MSDTVLKTVMVATGMSRRKAFTAIREGRIAEEGRPLLDPSQLYTGTTLSLDGVALTEVRQVRTYLLLNKPAGVITSASDELGRVNVLDLVPAELRRPGLHSVGRLDRDTTGLLVLTNDGDLTFRLTHPSYEVEKEYWVRTIPALSDSGLDLLAGGIELDGRQRAPLNVRRLDAHTIFEFSITVREGRNRHVRRMVEAIGARVTRLRRVREGGLEIGNLPEGHVRPLTRQEVRLLGGIPAATAARVPSPGTNAHGRGVPRSGR